MIMIKVREQIISLGKITKLSKIMNRQAVNRQESFPRMHVDHFLIYRNNRLIN